MNNYDKIIACINAMEQTIDNFDTELDVSGNMFFEYEYLRIITEHFNKSEIELLNSFWKGGVKAYKKDISIRSVMRKIRIIYGYIQKQTIFVQPLCRNKQYLMSMETYDFWMNGFCEVAEYKFKALDIFLVEKEKIGFEVYNYHNQILLKIE